MVHQPFDKWLLDEEPITFEQRRELEAHLLNCPQCQQLSANWKGVTNLIQVVPPAAPAPGFTRRWKAVQAERRTSQQPRQVRMFFLTLLAASLAALVMLVLFFVVSHISFSQVLVSAAHFLTSIYGFGMGIQTFIQTNLNGPLSWIVWVVFTSGISVLVIIWILTVTRITSKGAQKYEDNLPAGTD